MSLPKNAIIKASGNKFIQFLLEKNVQALQFLMGIGSFGIFLRKRISGYTELLLQGIYTP